MLCCCALSPLTCKASHEHVTCAAELQHHLQGMRHRLLSLQQHFTAPNMLTAAALVAGLLLAALLVHRALQRQVCFLLLYHITLGITGPL